MRKRCAAILALLLTVLIFQTPVWGEQHPEFGFELTVDGAESKQVQTGDVITVVLRLKRTDAADPYPMYAMQDEIRYDGNFFELVEGSAVLEDDVATTDIGMRDNFREFYMNYLSVNGGEQWEAEELIGSFQLRVIASSGVTKITNEDYLVSTEDGAESFACTANEITVFLSTDCTVHFESTGGSEVEDQIVQYGEKVVEPEPPVREGYELEGWYRDIDQTDRWDFDNDVVEGNMSLFAAWTEETVVPADESRTEYGFVWWIVLGVLVLLLLPLVLLRRKVTFDSTGGSQVKCKSVFKNRKITPPKEPKKNGQIFDGWYRDKDCTAAWNFEKDVVTGNLTLYAKWK